ARDLFVMRTVAREAAFEQAEALDGERARGEAARAIEEGGDLAAAAAFPAGERNVRVEGAALGLEGNRLAQALDLGGEGDQRSLWLDAGPERAGVSWLEAAGSGDAQLERRHA